jgi:ribosomal RNA-processing protein 17
MANKKKSKKVKNELVFDPKKRAEFLSGFSKRKQQRKKKAAHDNEVKLKIEMKRIKEEVSGI